MIEEVGQRVKTRLGSRGGGDSRVWWGVIAAEIVRYWKVTCVLRNRLVSSVTSKTFAFSLCARRSHPQRIATNFYSNT